MTTISRKTGHSRVTEGSELRAFSIVIGLASLAVLLQGVWAGIFIRQGQADNSTWVTVHARGAEVAIALAAIATILVFWRSRERRDLLVGSAAFTVLLIVESFIGGLVGGHADLEVVHFPLAMALLAFAVWLPLRARAARRVAQQG